MFAFRGPARRDATWWAVVWDKRGPSRSGAHGPLHLQALRPLRCRASLRGAASRHRRSGVFALQAARHRRKPPVFRPKKAPRRRKPPVFRPKEAPRRRKPTVFRPKKAPRHRKPTVFRPKTAPRRRKLAFEGYLSSPRRARRRWHARAPPPHRPALRPDPARAAGCTAQWRPSGGRRLLRRARRRAPGMKGDDALRKAEDRPAPPLCLAESRVNNPRRPVSSSCTIRGAATLMPTPSLARSSSPPMPPAASRTSPTSADRARRGGAGGVPPRSLCAWKNLDPPLSPRPRRHLPASSCGWPPRFNDNDVEATLSRIAREALVSGARRRRFGSSSLGSLGPGAAPSPPGSVPPPASGFSLRPEDRHRALIFSRRRVVMERLLFDGTAGWLWVAGPGADSLR